MVAVKAPAKAVKLDPDIRRRIGVGNSTGLGMAPFLINHPSLIHAWINARETALGRVRALAATDQAGLSRFVTMIAEAAKNANEGQPITLISMTKPSHCVMILSGLTLLWAALPSI